MTSIDPQQRLAALVRSEVSAYQDRAGTRGARGSGTTEGARGAAPASGSLLAQRLGAIAADDPQRRQKAFRVFLETSLLHELGPALIHDTTFAQMVDAVQSRMQADPQLAEAADAVAAHLLATSRRQGTAVT